MRAYAASRSALTRFFALPTEYLPASMRLPCQEVFQCLHRKMRLCLQVLRFMKSGRRPRGTCLGTETAGQRESP